MALCGTYLGLTGNQIGDKGLSGALATGALAQLKTLNLKTSNQ